MRTRERKSIWKVVFVSCGCADRNGATSFLRGNEHFRFTYRRRPATCCILSGTFPLTYQAGRPSQDSVNIYTFFAAASQRPKTYPWHHISWNLWILLYRVRPHPTRKATSVAISSVNIRLLASCSSLSDSGDCDWLTAIVGFPSRSCWKKRYQSWK